MLVIQHFYAGAEDIYVTEGLSAEEVRDGHERNDAVITVVPLEDVLKAIIVFWVKNNEM